MRRAIEQRIEDPLAEELLRGAFEGKNTIVIDTFKDPEGKVVRLDFRGENRENHQTSEPIAAGAT